MIVRKPYAFFIRHFRLFHVIFVLLAFMLIVSNISLFEFFDDYVSSTPSIISSYIVDSTYVNIIWNVLLIVGLAIVMGVLIYKKKDIRLYIVLIVVYVLVTILFVLANNLMSNLTRYLVDIRFVKAIHDFLLVTIFIQAIALGLIFTRATGFDIKKFDFARDYALLNVSGEDNEEVELDLEFDFNVFKTKVNKFIRNFKYFYLENKLVCIGIGVLFVICFFGSCYFYISNTSYVSVNGNIIRTSKYIIDIKDVFVDNADKSDNLIDGSNFIILKADIKLSYGTRNTFNTSNLMVFIGQKSFVPLKKYNQYFDDFGTAYNDEVIEGSGSYYFVYSIPSSISLDEIKLVYVDINKYYQKNLEYVDLRDNKVIGSYGIDDSILIENDFLKGIDFKIDEVSFKDKFLVPYIYKVSNEFYSSSYFVSPSISGNKDKSVIRFISNSCDIIDKYGVIYYDENKSSVSLKRINTLKSSDYCYYETDYNVINASTVFLELNIRGYLYKYYLK